METPEAPSPAFTVGMITWDCLDPRKMAAFWSAAIGAPIVEDFGDGDFIIIGATPNMAFQRVSEPTPGKNRIHIDGGGGPRAELVARLRQLGATEQETHTMPGFAWTVMADPEGNLFCVGDPHEQAG